MYKKFNVNHLVKVKLTDASKAMLTLQHEANNARIISAGGRALPGVGYTVDEEDGYSEFQLWELMEALGPLCQWGQLPFETDIYIDM